MFIADRLIYLQLQKTGCTHIVGLLRETIPGKQIGMHNRIPIDLARGNKLIVGSIRNPWDRYVSLWAFGCSNKGDFKHKVTPRSFRQHFLKLIKFPYRGVISIQNEARKPIKNWSETYADVDEPRLFRRWLQLVFNPERRYDLGEDYGFSLISSFAGFFTYRYIDLFSRDISGICLGSHINNIDELRKFDRENNVLNFTIRNECLEDDFIHVLSHAGYNLTEKQIYNIRTAKKRNSSVHKNTSFYYDTETIELVATKERLLIEKYDYKPPS